MTFHLEPVPGGFYDEIGGQGIEYDLDFLLSGDANIVVRATADCAWLRADVLVVAEERA